MYINRWQWSVFSTAEDKAATKPLTKSNLYKLHEENEQTMKEREWKNWRKKSRIFTLTSLSFVHPPSSRIGIFHLNGCAPNISSISSSFTGAIARIRLLDALHPAVKPICLILCSYNTRITSNYVLFSFSKLHFWEIFQGIFRVPTLESTQLTRTHFFAQTSLFSHRIPIHKWISENFALQKFNKSISMCIVRKSEKLSH